MNICFWIVHNEKALHETNDAIFHMRYKLIYNQYPVTALYVWKPETE